MKVLIFDNYDSFTYNLVHLVEDILQEKVDVYRNDAISLGEVNAYDKIILSPGPGIPSEAGLLLPLIEQYASTKPVLGVCLGHQAIAEAFGGKIINLSTVFHGVAHKVFIHGNTDDQLAASSLFNDLPNPFDAGRYHSWVVSDEQLPATLEVTARDENGYIMALKHKIYNVEGVQFHPESVLTPLGKTIISNWLNH